MDWVCRGVRPSERLRLFGCGLCLGENCEEVRFDGERGVGVGGTGRLEGTLDVVELDMFGLVGVSTMLKTSWS